jgi:hypothetical protein
MVKNGVYAVEDLHTAYWDEFEGGFRKPSTFVELCKCLVDELNADHSRDALPPTNFTRTTLSMHFYDSVVVFERGTHTKKWAPEIGTAPEPPETEHTSLLNRLVAQVKRKPEAGS